MLEAEVDGRGNESRVRMGEVVSRLGGLKDQAISDAETCTVAEK